MFFSLPRELRDEILTLTFCEGSAEGLSRLHIRGAAAPYIPLPLSILVCKQFYEEALPLYMRSIQLVVPGVVDLDLVGLGLGTKASKDILNNIQSIAFENLKQFRVHSPSQQCMRWDKQKDMPWRPVQEIGHIVFFTGITRESESADGKESWSSALTFLRLFPRLRYVELSTERIGSTPDRGFRGSRHYYDLLSLSTLPLLESVKIIVRLSGIRGKLYRTCLRRGEDRLRRMDRLVKARLDDGMGLVPWLQEGFEEAGKSINVKGTCVLVDRKVQRAENGSVQEERSII